MSALRVLLYVQHLLGIGHLKRAATISRALAEGGSETILVSGGAAVAKVDIGAAALHQLPPVRATEDFSALVDENGHEIDDAFKSARRDQLLKLSQTFRPEILITELFPFGRRQMRFELLPLLEEARSAERPPLILASVRDILQQGRKPQRIQEAMQWFNRYYDHLLVHADPHVVSLDESLPAVTEITDRTHYTGYVVDGEAVPTNRADGGGDEVVVSAGGGAVGETLLRTAIAAKSGTVYRDLTWRFLAGHNMPNSEFDSIRAKAGAGIVVERARTDFPALLASSALSISQCGYNTMMELLNAGIRAVVVPFAGDGETEQSTRAQIWAVRGGVTVLAQDELSPATLARAVNEAAEGPICDSSAIDLNGARHTAELVGRLAATKGSAS